jgi:hypothetical protein
MIRHLRIRFWELISYIAMRAERLALKVSDLALNRRARACGCEHCRFSTDEEAQHAAVRELLAAGRGKRSQPRSQSARIEVISPHGPTPDVV